MALVVIGKVVRAIGLKGFLGVAGSEGALGDVEAIVLRRRDGSEQSLRIEEARPQGRVWAVKLEGVDGHEDVIRQIVGSGVPVMGHIGLTPQSVHQFGGFRVQGRSDADASRLVRQAQTLEHLGCFSIVLECIPAELAARIRSELTIPTIGIGAGAETDGQVLVLHDLVGLDQTRTPRFVRRYADGEGILTAALDAYDADVKEARFPDPQESYR